MTARDFLGNDRIAELESKGYSPEYIKALAKGQYEAKKKEFADSGIREDIAKMAIAQRLDADNAKKLNDEATASAPDRFLRNVFDTSGDEKAVDDADQRWRELNPDKIDIASRVGRLINRINPLTLGPKITDKAADIKQNGLTADSLDKDFALFAGAGKFPNQFGRAVNTAGEKIAGAVGADGAKQFFGENRKFFDDNVKELDRIIAENNKEWGEVGGAIDPFLAAPAGIFTKGAKLANIAKSAGTGFALGVGMNELRNAGDDRPLEQHVKDDLLGGVIMGGANALFSALSRGKVNNISNLAEDLRGTSKAADGAEGAARAADDTAALDDALDGLGGAQKEGAGSASQGANVSDAAGGEQSAARAADDVAAQTNTASAPQGAQEIKSSPSSTAQGAQNAEAASKAQSNLEPREQLKQYLKTQNVADDAADEILGELERGASRSAHLSESAFKKADELYERANRLEWAREYQKQVAARASELAQMRTDGIERFAAMQREAERIAKENPTLSARAQRELLNSRIKPSEAELRYTRAYNDGADVDPMYAGQNFIWRVENDIKAHPYTTEQYGARLASKGFAPDVQAAAMQAYDDGDIKFLKDYIDAKVAKAEYDDIVNNKMNDWIIKDGKIRRVQNGKANADAAARGAHANGAGAGGKDERVSKGVSDLGDTPSRATRGQGSDAQVSSQRGSAAILGGEDAKNAAGDELVGRYGSASGDSAADAAASKQRVVSAQDAPDQGGAALKSEARSGDLAAKDGAGSAKQGAKLDEDMKKGFVNVNLTSHLAGGLSGGMLNATDEEGKFSPERFAVGFIAGLGGVAVIRKGFRASMKAYAAKQAKAYPALANDRADLFAQALGDEIKSRAKTTLFNAAEFVKTKVANKTGLDFEPQIFAGEKAYAELKYAPVKADKLEKAKKMWQEASEVARRGSAGVREAVGAGSKAPARKDGLSSSAKLDTELKIWRETGWFRDKDGAWKFEIGDADAKLNPKFQSGGKLGELLEHDELFKAYPELKDVKVVKMQSDAPSGAMQSVKDAGQKEKRGIYNVTYNNKIATYVKQDLDQIEGALRYARGDRSEGAKHIKIRHLNNEGSEGYVSKKELLDLGESMRKYLAKYKEPFINECNARVYEWQDDKGVRFRLVASNKSAGTPYTAELPRPADFEDIITFYSDRNLKKPMEFENPKVRYDANLQNWHEHSAPITKNADGSPKVFYHGSSAKDITEFKGEFDKSGYGFWFSQEKEIANEFREHGKIYKVYLKSSNPIDLSFPYSAKAQKLLDEAEAKGINTELYPDKQSDGFKKFLKSKGYDGIVMQDIDGVDAKPYLIVFDSNQIKHVKNSGNFSASPNIYQSGEAGYFDPQSNTIALKSLNDRSTLMHEIQHWVQSKEGFATGGTRGDANYAKLHGEAEARNVQTRLGLDDATRAQKDPLGTFDVGPDDTIVLRSGGANASEVLKKDLMKGGRLNKEMMKEVSPALPKSFENKSEFEKAIGGSGDVSVQTPIGEINVNTNQAYKHFTQNTFSQDRSNFSGGLIQTLKEPLFIIRNPVKNQTEFYKTFTDKNGFINLMSVVKKDNGKLKLKTIFDVDVAKLENAIKDTPDGNVLYYKLAGETKQASLETTSAGGLNGSVPPEPRSASNPDSIIAQISKKNADFGKIIDEIKAKNPNIEQEVEQSVEQIYKDSYKDHDTAGEVLEAIRTGNFDALSQGVQTNLSESQLARLKKDIAGAKLTHISRDGFTFKKKGKNGDEQMIFIDMDEGGRARINAYSKAHIDESIRANETMFDRLFGGDEALKNYSFEVKAKFLNEKDPIKAEQILKKADQRRFAAQIASKSKQEQEKLQAEYARAARQADPFNPDMPTMNDLLGKTDALLGSYGGADGKWAQFVDTLWRKGINKYENAVDRIFEGENTPAFVKKGMSVLDLRNAAKREIDGAIESFFRESAAINAQARTAAKYLDKFDAAQSEQLFNALDGKIVKADLPQELQATYQKLRDAIDHNANELIKAGALKEENKLTDYIGHYYDEYMQNERGKISRTLGKFYARKDLSEAQKRALGLRTDISFVVANTLAKQRTQLLKARALQSIADRFGLDEIPAAAKQGQYVRISDETVGGGIKKFGALAGKYVPKEVAEALKSTQALGGQLGALEKYGVPAIDHIKVTVTVKNPVTHIYNVASNAILAFLHGDEKALASWALLGRQKRQEYWKLARRLGLDSAMDDLEGAIRGLKPKNDSEAFGVIGKAVDFLITAGKNIYMSEGSAVGKAVRKAYAWEDEIFKIARFKKNLDAIAAKRGYAAGDLGKFSEKELAAAMSDAQYHYVDYSTHFNGFLRKLDKSGLTPFLHYSVKSTPMVIKAILKNPHRFAMMQAAFIAADAAGLSLSSIIADTEKDNLTKPKWAQSSRFPNVFGLKTWARVGNSDTYFNAGRAVPGFRFDEMFDLKGGGFIGGLVQIIFFGKSPLGYDIESKEDSGAESARKRAKELAKNYLPSFTIGRYGQLLGEQALSDITGDKDYAPKDYNKDELGYAGILKRSVGARRFNQQKELNAELGKLRKQKMELEYVKVPDSDDEEKVEKAVKHNEKLEKMSASEKEKKQKQIDHKLEIFKEVADAEGFEFDVQSLKRLRDEKKQRKFAPKKFDPALISRPQIGKFSRQ
nr:MAG TPA: PolyVal ADP-Ribosyltransferase [Caudoviricetes sp.]